MGKTRLIMADAEIIAAKTCSQTTQIPAQTGKRWQPVVEGNIISNCLKKMDAFKSMGSSRIQPRVLKEMTGTLPTSSEKKWYWGRSLMIGKKVTICPYLRKMKIQETTDSSALSAVPQTHRGQKGNQKWSGWVYLR